MSCNKSNVDNPEFIECYVNGAKWKSRGGDRHVDWSDGGKFFNLAGYDPSMNANLSIVIYDSTKTLNTASHTLNSINYGRYNDQDISYRYSFKTDSLNTGEISISFDEVNKIISGTFSFKAKFETTSDIVYITDGRFSMTGSRQK